MSEPVAAASSPQVPLIRVAGVTKRFGGVQALRGVNLEVLPGEVHALLGENGAGKSTLIKILSGVHAYDEGSIEIAGERVAFDSPAQSRAAGVAVVYQDLSLVESLSVGANLMLGREPRTRLGFVKKRQLMAMVERLSAGPRHSARCTNPCGFPPLRLSPDDGDLQGVDGRRAHTDPRRAHLRADRRRGTDSLRRYPHGDQPRCGRHLRDPPVERGLSYFAACHGVP
jgi:hypothetical protein